MPDIDDMDLVREYAGRNSEPAFTELVRRHINLVHSVALRFTNDPEDAREVTQAVFIIFARKAAALSRGTILTGWLYETTRFTSLNCLRNKSRRQAREQEAFMQSTLNHSNSEDAWNRLAPHLEDAMSCLSEKERTMVALRYFENKSCEESAALLGIDKWAAQKRASRAVDKLRIFFTRRGIILPAAVLVGAISANSIQAAPAALQNSVTVVALSKGASAGGSTLTLIKGAMKIMAWTKIKTAVVLGTVVLLAGGATTIVVSKTASPSIDDSLWQPDSRVFNQVPPVLIIRPTRSPGVTGSISKGDKALLLNAAVAELLSVAYGIPQANIVLPEGLPADHFDLMLTLNDHAKEALQAEIKKRFRLVGRRETRDADGYVLTIGNSNAPGLAPSIPGTTASSSSMSSSTSIGALPPEVAARIHARPGAGSGNQTTMNNQTMADFAMYLEKTLGAHVVDQTGTTNRFDIKLRVLRQNNESSEDALKRSLHEQLGLELAHNSEPAEMLIIEKAGN